jgi:periplasmic copper chaperone A
MRVNLKQLAGACAALCLSTSLYAGNTADSIVVEGAFARAVPPGQTNSAAFMSLTNQDDTDHSLAGAESDASKVVELHSHTMEEGMMKMRRVEKVDLPAGETVKLEPGGLHVMLIGLERQLSPGEDVEITLIFEDGSRSTLTAPVKKVGAKMEHEKHH